ncbi:MAG: AMP-binding protein, partial [Cyanobacteria bacterium P01_D01_bin.36]
MTANTPPVGSSSPSAHRSCPAIAHGSPFHPNSTTTPVTPSVHRSAARSPSVSFPTGQPADLVTALQQAAKTDAGIRYIDPIGADYRQPYAELWQESCNIAANIEAHNLKPGSWIILQFLNSASLISAFWGATLAGCVPVPVTAAMPQGPAASKDAI